VRTRARESWTDRALESLQVTSTILEEAEIRKAWFSRPICSCGLEAPHSGEIAWHSDLLYCFLLSTLYTLFLKSISRNSSGFKSLSPFLRHLTSSFKSRTGSLSFRLFDCCLATFSNLPAYIVPKQQHPATECQVTSKAFLIGLDMIQLFRRLPPLVVSLSSLFLLHFIELTLISWRCRNQEPSRIWREVELEEWEDTSSHSFPLPTGFSIIRVRLDGSWEIWLLVSSTLELRSFVISQHEKLIFRNFDRYHCRSRRGATVTLLRCYCYSADRVWSLLFLRRW